MKTESAIIIAVAMCTFLAFYFSFLSFTTTEDSLKKQLVLLSVYSLLSGIIVFSCLIIYLAIKKIFVKNSTKRNSSLRASKAKNKLILVF